MKQAHWLSQCIKDPKGKPIPNVANAITALEHDAEIRDALGYDRDQAQGFGAPKFHHRGHGQLSGDQGGGVYSSFPPHIVVKITAGGGENSLDGILARRRSEPAGGCSLL